MDRRELPSGVFGQRWIAGQCRHYFRREQHCLKVGSRELLDCYALGEVPWFIDIAPKLDGEMIGEEL
jgi:hypothetical protein